MCNLGSQVCDRVQAPLSWMALLPHTEGSAKESLQKFKKETWAINPMVTLAELWRFWAHIVQRFRCSIVTAEACRGLFSAAKGVSDCENEAFLDWLTETSKKMNRKKYRSIPQNGPKVYLLWRPNAKRRQNRCGSGTTLNVQIRHVWRDQIMAVQWGPHPP